jgi:hypothetical protein
MKNVRTQLNGGTSSARLWKSTAVLLTGLALTFALWVATAPVSIAQGTTPTQMIEGNLPQGKTVETATKAEFLGALCSAIQKNPNSAPQIVRFATEIKKAWSNDILRTAFRCAGSGNCKLLGRILANMVAVNPDEASALTDLAVELAPSCAKSFEPGGGDDGGGNFGNPPGNVNPPPGSTGGGGGQSNVVAVCLNGRTVFVSPRGADDLLNNNPGATLGPCVVTPAQNQ